MGEAKLEGNAPPLLFLQPIGVDPGQRLYQRGFAVIDVTCRPDDH